MAQMEITPSEMMNIANQLKGKLQEWESHVDKIYTLHGELDAMWEGSANDAFNKAFAEDKQKFTRLKTMMEEYRTTIEQLATHYIEIDKTGVKTFSR